MWLATVVPLLALTAADPQATAGGAVAASAVPAPVYTRQSLFSIPFRIERPDRITREPVEVQLYVSGDRGTHWDLYRKAEPARQHFLFRAGVDGEYWFSVRTVDRSGQIRPQGAPTPGLVVIVDTTPPRLQLDARRGNAGQVTASFQIDEVFPKLDTLSIQYRMGPGAAWQTVAMGHQDIRTNGKLSTGEVTWWPPAGGGTMEIRAEVSDMAGNPAVSNARLAMDDSGSATVASASPGADPSRPRDPWRPSAPDSPVAHWPPERSPAAVGGSSALAASGRPTDPPAGPVAMQPSPAIRNQYVALDDKSGGKSGDRPTRMVNARVFELEYDAQSVGSSGIGRVELWGTRDNGQTWRSFGIDEHRRSPFVAKVDEEGIYGFRLVIQSGAGLGGRPPQRGDSPEVWIGVDLTKPTGRITAAQQGAGPDADKLNIAWEASDNLKLAARPISLSYGETIGGPWKTIAAELDNNGHYTWKLDSRLPGRVYLRLEVRDEAGNVGTYETPEPLSLDHSEPTARIRSVHSLGQSADPSADRSSLR